LVPLDEEARREEPRSSLRNWRQKKRVAASDTQRYSRFVRIMKITLPLVAFSLVVMVVIYSMFGRDPPNFKIELEHRAGSADDHQLIAPRLTGTDGKGQPFTVTATAATQAPGRSQKMNFENVNGDITMQDKSWMSLQATRGMMDGEAKTLDLYDTINIFTDRGYECHTNSARYDFGAGVLQGDHDISCQGPLGIITAKAFEGLKDPGRMTFLGGVQTTIFPASRDDAAKREAADPNSAGNGSQSDAPIAPELSATTPAPAGATATPAGATPATTAPAGTPQPSAPLPRQKPTLP